MEMTIEGMKQFIKDREAIRKGESVDDHVLNNSRFCNMFREDDKVSQWIYKNCNTINQVVFARLVNRIDLLEPLKDSGWNVEAFVSKPGPYTNAKAYCFYPKKGEVMTDLIKDIMSIDWTDELQSICKDVSIEEASIEMSEYIGRSLYFYSMMVILDLGHMKLVELDMLSTPYMGPGGVRVLKGLGMSLEALSGVLGLPMYHVEHITCEYRKYVDRTNNGIQNNRRYTK